MHETSDSFAPFAAIILCGGKSSRMGQDKSQLRFGSQTSLQRIVETLRTMKACGYVVVVAAAEQELPVLPGCVCIERDRSPEQGPLEGLIVGLRSVRRLGMQTCYVTSCDVPLLRQSFVQEIINRLLDYDAAVPTDSVHWQPLSAAYRADVAEAAEELLKHNSRSLMSLLGKLRVNAVAVEELRSFDEDLRSLCNVNTPEDYQHALRLAADQYTSENGQTEFP